MSVQKTGLPWRSVATLATVLCMASPAAHAMSGDLGDLPELGSTYTIGWDFFKPTFTDTLSFDLSAPAKGSFVLAGQALPIPMLATIPAASGLSMTIYKGGGAVTGAGATFSGLNLAAGTDYSFVVSGMPGGYKVTWALSPVPEPESLALVLAGLGVIGVAARRRLS